MRKLTVVLAVVMGLLGSMSRAAVEEWPQDVRTQFYLSCKWDNRDMLSSAGGDYFVGRFCSCLLDEYSKTATVDEYVISEQDQEAVDEKLDAANEKCEAYLDAKTFGEDI